MFQTFCRKSLPSWIPGYALSPKDPDFWPTFPEEKNYLWWKPQLRPRSANTIVQPMIANSPILYPDLAQDAIIAALIYV